MALKNIDNEIRHLLDMKSRIDSFNAFVKSVPNALAITQCKLDELSCQGLLNEGTLYCVCDNDIAQYIDECIL